MRAEKRLLIVRIYREQQNRIRRSSVFRERSLCDAIFQVVFFFFLNHESTKHRSIF